MIFTRLFGLWVYNYRKKKPVALFEYDTNEHRRCAWERLVLPAQINIALACEAEVPLLFTKIQYLFVLLSPEPYTLVSWGLLRGCTGICLGAMF